MKCSLLVTNGSLQGKVIPIAKSTFVIGRDASCHLRPASQTISKRHCAVHIRAEGVVLEDLGSTNGTFLNDEKCEGSHPLQNGDRLKVGPLEFVVKVEVAAQVDKSTLVDKVTETKLPTPAPAPAPAPAAKAKKPAEDELLDDDAIANMLLEGGDEVPSRLDDPESSSSSTVMEMLTPTQMEQLAQSGPAAPYRPPTNKPASSASSSQAAKAILEKYRRRPKA
jgi:pSer/pThr/pTyr-binding forkhead associated (FHA) protein